MNFKIMFDLKNRYSVIHLIVSVLNLFHCKDDE
jgi:hypothetical protein